MRVVRMGFSIAKDEVDILFSAIRFKKLYLHSEVIKIIIVVEFIIIVSTLR